MKLSNGLTSSGCYGTFEGEQVQLQSETPVKGVLEMLVAGEESPGPGWTSRIVYGTPTKAQYWSRHVLADRVSDIHYVKTTGLLGRWRVNVVGEFDGLMEVRAGAHDVGQEGIAVICREFNLHNWEQVAAYGWVDAALVKDIRTEA